MVDVTIWNEFRHEREDDAVAAVYPDGIHETLADALNDDHAVRTATLEEPEHGLTEDVLASTDVLLWWATRPTTRCETRSSTEFASTSSREWD